MDAENVETVACVMWQCPGCLMQYATDASAEIVTCCYCVPERTIQLRPPARLPRGWAMRFAPSEILEHSR